MGKSRVDSLQWKIHVHMKWIQLILLSSIHSPLWLKNFETYENIQKRGYQLITLIKLACVVCWSHLCVLWNMSIVLLSPAPKSVIASHWSMSHVVMLRSTSNSPFQLQYWRGVFFWTFYSWIIFWETLFICSQQNWLLNISDRIFNMLTETRNYFIFDTEIRL